MPEPHRQRRNLRQVWRCTTMSAKTKPETPALALTVEDAANALSLGYDAFKEHVWPELQIVRVGKRKMVASQSSNAGSTSTRNRSYDDRPGPARRNAHVRRSGNP